jgi:hypothetical protein
MKKAFFFFAFIGLHVLSMSQMQFEPGYIIDESGQRIECYIKNRDWKNNPTGVEYRLSTDGANLKASTSDIREFGIPGVFKYKSALVKIDKSSIFINELSNEKEPAFEEELLFLKVLVEGEASLYSYTSHKFIRFFYNRKDSDITPLVYKIYRVDKAIRYNLTYKNQLFDTFHDQQLQWNDFDRIKYEQKDLINLFIRFNAHYDTGSVTYKPRKKTHSYAITFKPGLNYNRLAINNSMSGYYDIEFNPGISARWGLETEYYLPFYANTWSLIAEPTYQSFYSRKLTEMKNLPGGFLVSDVYYNSIELPIGLRYHIYMGEKSKIFINTTFLLDFSSSSSHIQFSHIDGKPTKAILINSRPNFGVGVGYKYRNRFSVELGYQTRREILGQYLMWSSQYQTLSIAFGYSVFIR